MDTADILGDMYVTEKRREEKRREERETERECIVYIGNEAVGEASWQAGKLYWR
jgi:hypothetical protein